MIQPFHELKGPFVRQLEPEQRFIAFYLLRSKRLEPFRDATRGVFLTLVLADRTGQILGRVWENAEAISEAVEEGQVLKIEGEVETYMDRIQIRVLRIRPAQDGEYDQRDYIPSSERDADELLAAVQSAIDRIDNSYLRSLVDHFYTDPDFLAQLRQAPAARRVHHAYLGGLLENTADLLTLAGAVLEVYPQIDRDLLVSGVLLHDIGKLREYAWDLDIQATDEGQLLGHVVITDEMVNRALQTIPDFPAELALRLRHLLVSQRGRYEWGSPRRPQTLEAIALHHLSNLSAQVSRFQQLIENRPPGEPWTSYDRLLGRQLYAGSDGELNVEEQDWAE